MLKKLIASLSLALIACSASANQGATGSTFDTNVYSNPAPDYGVVEEVMNYLEGTVTKVGEKIIDGMKNSGGRVPGVVPGFNPTPVPNLGNIAAEVGAATGAGIRTGGGGNIYQGNPKNPPIEGGGDQLLN